jgi:SAM-dependent methyltransferase
MTNDVNSPSKWEANYQFGTDGWDLRGPTPVFSRLLATGHYAPGRLIVLGAGRGHDARLFARQGFRVTAVDFSPTAAREMERLAEAAAPVEIIQADIFTLPHTLDSTFDYLLEYTCFCAIDPQRRAEYAQLVNRLLKPGGLYIDLAFPLDSHAGGPPFAVNIPQILSLFSPPTFNLTQRETPPDSVPQRRGQEELLIFQKTH